MTLQRLANDLIQEMVRSEGEDEVKLKDQLMEALRQTFSFRKEAPAVAAS